METMSPHAQPTITTTTTTTTTERAVRSSMMLYTMQVNKQLL
jgi:hypothetical protein